MNNVQTNSFKIYTREELNKIGSTELLELRVLTNNTIRNYRKAIGGLQRGHTLVQGAETRAKAVQTLSALLVDLAVKQTSLAAEVLRRRDEEYSYKMSMT